MNLPTSWKAPYRPSNEVTQDFNDGVVTVYAVTDSAQPGYQAKPQLVEPPKLILRYEEQRLGIKRYYDAMQNQIQVERVIRVPRAGQITNQDAAVTEDGRRYRIEMVQTVQDVWPPCLDLTLAKYSQGDTGEEAQHDVV